MRNTVIKIRLLLRRGRIHLSQWYGCYCISLKPRNSCWHWSYRGSKSLASEIDGRSQRTDLKLLASQYSVLKIPEQHYFGVLSAFGRSNFLFSWFSSCSGFQKHTSCFDNIYAKRLLGHFFRPNKQLLIDKARCSYRLNAYCRIRAWAIASSERIPSK